MNRRRMKGQKSKSFTVTLSPAEDYIMKEEAKGRGLSLSALTQDLIQAYFGSALESLEAEFAQRAAEESGRNGSTGRRPRKGSADTSSSTPSGTESHSDESTVTV